MAKLALFADQNGIVQILFNEYVEESPNCVFIPDTYY